MRALAVAALVALASSLDAQSSGAAARFTVGTAAASRGQTAYGAIVVPPGVDSGMRMPVAVVHGARPGRVVAFVAGSHGTEYASVVALARLIARIDPNTLTGTVIIAPLLNVASWEQMTVHVNPIDRKGMNASYPGDPNGTQSPRALALVSQQVVAPADVIVDLHGGDIDEELRPYSYWIRTGNAAQDSASRALALAFGLDHIILRDVDVTNPASARSLSGYALSKGKITFVAEAGHAGTVETADVTALIDGALNVLGALGMTSRTVKPVENPVWLGTDTRVRADSTAMFFPSVQRGTYAARGMKLGELTDLLGRKTADVRAPSAGVVTFIRGVPSVWAGATLVTVIEVLTAPRAWVKPG